ncbi:MAG TPA: FAD binding domain-containing protein, partial [Verrucomicrobiae bacterium]|nr:FAD binding domain-containing protein [Verrucomicrobiae bacterium]
MKSFAYATALSADSAHDLVADHGDYLAGGNDLLGLLKDYLIPGPNILVNVKSLPGLNRIERGDKSWTIGALVTVAELERDPDIAKVFPGLHEAAMEIASPQIRNVATVGGNL